MDSGHETLWKPAEVAKRLGLSVSTVYLLMRTTELKTVVTVERGRVRARALVPESAVKEFEARQKVAL